MAETLKESEQLEWIVQEVIRRLLSQGVGVVDSPARDSALRIEDRVITLATLEGRLQGITHLQIKSQAVITPAVKDKLRDMNVELIRGT